MSLAERHRHPDTDAGDAKPASLDTEPRYTRKLSYYRDHTLDPSLVRYYWSLLGPSKVVLDLGCGVGCLGRLKPSSLYQVYGVDNDKGALDVAQLYEETLPVDLASAQLPYPDGFFDGAVAKDILEHLSDPLAMLEELRRVLRVGGTLLVSVPMAKPQVVWNDYTHIRGYTRRAVVNMLSDGGFDIISVQPMGGIPLVGRLGIARWLPQLMRLPGMARGFGRSYQALARRAIDPAE